MRAVEDRNWLVSFLDYDLGFFDKERGRVEPAPSDARSADRRTTCEAAKPPFKSVRTGPSVNYVSGIRCKPCDRLTPKKIGGQGRNRTTDTRIFSPLLYQLSYLAIPGQSARRACGALLRDDVRSNEQNPGSDTRTSGVLDRLHPSPSRNPRSIKRPPSRTACDHALPGRRRVRQGRQRKSGTTPVLYIRSPPLKDTAMATDELFRDDAYLQFCTAIVTRCEDNRLYVDRTVFYPQGGGQPGDVGQVKWTSGQLPVVDTVYGTDGEIAHVVAEGPALPPAGTEVELSIDWDRRYRHMRMHTALHLLGAVLKFPVTGGNISTDKSRLDFDMDGTIEKEALATSVNELVDREIGRAHV